MSIIVKSLLKRLPAILACAVFLLQASACSSGSKAANVKTVGVLMPTKLSERWVNDGSYIVQQFQTRGYNTQLDYAENDVKTQVSQIQDMIADHVSCMVISAIDSGALTEALSETHAAKIPVISYDRLIMNTPYIDCYASFNNYQVGVLQGRYIVDALGLKTGKRSYNIELFGGSPDDNNAYFFYNGSMAVLSPYIASGRLVVRSGQTKMSQISTLRWDGATAQARMASLLSENYTSARVDAVLSPYDGISLGIISALRSAGYGTKAEPWPIVTGQDAEVASIKSIVASEQSMTVFKDTRELAKLAVDMAVDILSGKNPPVNDATSYNNGKKIVPAFLLTPVVVTKANYMQALVRSGYYTEDQLQ